MNIVDKIRIHKAALENLEKQIEMHASINLFEKKIQSKKDNPLKPELAFWTISELEKSINEYKDLLHGYKTVYKELIQPLNT